MKPVELEPLETVFLGWKDVINLWTVFIKPLQIHWWDFM